MTMQSAGQTLPRGLAMMNLRKDMKNVLIGISTPVESCRGLPVLDFGVNSSWIYPHWINSGRSADWKESRCLLARRSFAFC